MISALSHVCMCVLAICKVPFKNLMWCNVMEYLHSTLSRYLLCTALYMLPNVIMNKFDQSICKLSTISWNSHQWWAHAHVWNQPMVSVNRWHEHSGCSAIMWRKLEIHLGGEASWSRQIYSRLERLLRTYRMHIELAVCSKALDQPWRV